MADWNATQYLIFERERTRPAADLLAGVLLDAPDSIVDLGCGPGNSTKLLVDRYPAAKVLGIDTSPDMLAKARASLPATEFALADVATWQPAQSPDIIFANAVLQWVPDHATLLPRLASLVAPGGALAIQMPDNLEEPSHALMRETAAEAPYAAKLAGAAAARETLGSFDDLYRWLRPVAAHVDLWRTTYVHPLEGAGAIVEWVKATGLRPFIDPLDDSERHDFLERYERKLETAYPRQADGRALLRFPRLFIVAAQA
jgi:trans-aconitate 2-methyltransferase